jgi:hypothetical protein
MLETDGKPPQTFRSVEAFAELPGMVHNFRNASATDPAKALGLGSSEGRAISDKRSIIADYFARHFRQSHAMRIVLQLHPLDRAIRLDHFSAGQPDHFPRPAAIQ